MNFVDELFSLEEVKVLKGVSVLTSVWAREWQYKDFLNEIDGLMWEDLSEDWHKDMSERRKSCLVKSALCPQEVPVRTGTQCVLHQVPKKKKMRAPLCSEKSLFRSVLDVRWINLEQDVSR